MGNKVFQTKVNLYTEIIKKHLLANGVNYVVGQDTYIYTIGKVPYRLTIKDEVITIECGMHSHTEHYIFPTNRADILLEHYDFSTSNIKETHITHSKLVNINDELQITTDAITLDGSNDRESCANKIVFFSRELLGEGLFNTLAKIRFIDSSVPSGVTQDIPRNTNSENALRDMIFLEEELRLSLKQKITR